MGWKFRKRVTIIPGFTLNLSKSVISTTVGIKGLSINSGKDGTYLNTGIPSTGIYDRIKLDNKIQGNKALKDKKRLETIEISCPNCMNVLNVNEISIIECPNCGYRWKP